MGRLRFGFPFCNFFGCGRFLLIQPSLDLRTRRGRFGLILSDAFLDRSKMAPDLPLGLSGFAFRLSLAVLAGNAGRLLPGPG